MLKFIKSIAKRKLVMGVTAFVLAAVLLLSGVSVGEKLAPQSDSSFSVGVGQKVITIGTEALAAGTADYTADGVADDVQFQAALNALPTNGGKISVLTGNYVFSATVTRAIPNVTIEGNGLSTNFTYDGVNPIFSAGGNNWVFRNFVTDAGGVNVGVTTGWSQVNVTLGATHYAYRTENSITASSWDIPSGRGATIIVASVNATAAEKAQADYLADGTNDQVEINAAVAALQAGEGGRVQLSSGGFALGASIVIPSVQMYQYLQQVEIVGRGIGTMLYLASGANSAMVTFGDNASVYTEGGRLANLMLDGNAVGQNGSITHHAIVDIGSPTRLTLEGLYIRQVDGHAINFSNARYSRMINNDIWDGIAGSAIRLDGAGTSAHTWIAFNLLSSNQHAVVLYDNDNWVESNYIVDAGSGAANTYAGVYNAGLRNHILNNRFENEVAGTTKYAIDGSDIYQAEFKGNTIVAMATAPVNPAIFGTPPLYPSISEFYRDNKVFDTTFVWPSAKYKTDLSDTLANLGTVKGMWPFFDTTGTAVGDFGRLSHNMTASSNLQSWATAPSQQGDLIVYNFDGTNDYLDTADHDDFTFGNSTADSPFSIMFWFKSPAVAGASYNFVSKIDITTGNTQKEYLVIWVSNTIYFDLYDDNTTGNIGRGGPAVFATSTWYQIVATYSGSGVASGIKIYINGVQIDNANDNSGIYVAMENKGAKLAIGYYTLANGSKLINLKGGMTVPVITGAELSADTIWAEYQRGRVLLSLN